MNKLRMKIRIKELIPWMAINLKPSRKKKQKNHYETENIFKWKRDNSNII